MYNSSNYFELDHELEDPEGSVDVSDPSQQALKVFFELETSCGA